MRTRLAAVILAALVPAVGFAQGKRGAAAPDPSTSASAPASPMAAKAPTARDLSGKNPAALLLDKRKKLSLADSTVAQLKALEKKINDRNAAFYSQYDSVHKWTEPMSESSSHTASGPGFRDADQSAAPAGASAGEQARMQSSMRDLRALMADYRERRKADVSDALAVVPDGQKKGATDLLTQQDGDVDKLLGTRP
jgi:hypothetical protein